jgi:hypothetical protein
MENVLARSMFYSKWHSGKSLKHGRFQGHMLETTRVILGVDDELARRSDDFLQEDFKLLRVEHAFLVFISFVEHVT